MSNDGLRLLLMLVASPKAIAELELPKAPLPPDGAFAPATSVPFSTVVAPVYVLAPESVRASPPTFVSVKPPLTTPPKLMFPVPPMLLLLPSATVPA
jgi:hypothetical protein